MLQYIIKSQGGLMNKIIFILFLSFGMLFSSEYQNILCIDKNKKEYNIQRSVNIIIIDKKFKAYYTGSIYGDDSVYKNKMYTYGFAFDTPSYYADFFIKNKYGYYSTGICKLKD
jgi:hypothetical protein